ncbi:hypothetical protein EUX98_g4927 [Antrodiella citrinella]|uniref:NADH pyrophosphatase-like N-terminal domain-containing protein n=1 Tax=Antrodiella citrinella TaxID=2447956 RepID=A0A4S4MVL0_9APHY|nr:hypothetical protein EUX98_g4927 [Antrodiella citrinella]
MESTSDSDPKSFSLARLTTADVKGVVGPEPYFAQSKNAGEATEIATPVLESARFHGPPITFLGLQEPGGVHGLGVGNILPSSEFSKKLDVSAVAQRIQGEPVFSLDVSALAKDEVATLLSVKSGPGSLEFVDGRAAMGHLNQIDSGIFAVARSMVDWNSRIKPFPANIMSGFYAIADANEPVRTDLDNELEDAQWYTRDEVLSILDGKNPEAAFKLLDAPRVLQ